MALVIGVGVLCLSLVPGAHRRPLLARVPLPRVTVSLLTDDEMKGVFTLFDKDSNGTIDTLELRTMMTQLGQRPTEEQLTQLLVVADFEGLGKIDFLEFRSVLMRQDLLASIKPWPWLLSRSVMPAPSLIPLTTVRRTRASAPNRQRRKRWRPLWHSRRRRTSGASRRAGHRVRSRFKPVIGSGREVQGALCMPCAR